MYLSELRLADVRCLRDAELRLHPRLNLITGANGAGKTSLLEAVYLLGRGRSFRSRITESLIRHGAQRLQVFGRVSRQAGAETVNTAMGVQCDRTDGISARIDGSAAGTLTQLSEAFPVQVLDPGIHRLVEEGPVQRRRWLDWAVFHVEPSFIPAWQAYTRTLRQRNAALKQGMDAVLWEPELVRLGEQLTQARARLLDALQPFWSAALVSLQAVPATLRFYGGWSAEQSLAESLAAHRERDRSRGLTGSGPHRFDVVVRLQGRPVREVVSRGQQKMLGAAMALTMARYVSEAVGQPPTLLLDDPSAELDPAHTEALLASVRALGGQQLVTALRPGDTPLGVPDQVFHVEQEGVKRL